MSIQDVDCSDLSEIQKESLIKLITDAHNCINDDSRYCKCGYTFNTQFYNKNTPVYKILLNNDVFLLIMKAECKHKMSLNLIRIRNRFTEDEAKGYFITNVLNSVCKHNTFKYIYLLKDRIEQNGLSDIYYQQCIQFFNSWHPLNISVLAYTLSEEQQYNVLTYKNNNAELDKILKKMDNRIIYSANYEYNPHKIFDEYEFGTYLLKYPTIQEYFLNRNKRATIRILKNTLTDVMHFFERIEYKTNVPTYICT